MTSFHDAEQVLRREANRSEALRVALLALGRVLIKFGA